MLTEHPNADLETLAAFLDGRLSGEEKARVEERLLRDERYYEIFLETVHFREENEAAGGAVPVPFPGRRIWRIAVPLAAAALLAVAIGFLLVAGRRTSSGEWVAALDASAIVARDGWDDPGWSRLRSANITKGRYSSEELAFRLGVRAVDLRVALMARNEDASKRLAAVLEQLADAADLFPVALAYEDLSGRLVGAEPETLLAQAAEMERLLFASFEESSPEGRRLVLGAWSEAGRLAALSHDEKALGRVFREDPGLASIDGMAGEIEDLKTLREARGLGEEDFDEALGAFQKIVIALAD